MLAATSNRVIRSRILAANTLAGFVMRAWNRGDIKSFPKWQSAVWFVPEGGERKRERERKALPAAEFAVSVIKLTLDEKTHVPLLKLSSSESCCLLARGSSQCSSGGLTLIKLPHNGEKNQNLLC